MNNSFLLIPPTIYKECIECKSDLSYYRLVFYKQLLEEFKDKGFQNDEVYHIVGLIEKGCYNNSKSCYNNSKSCIEHQDMLYNVTSYKIITALSNKTLQYIIKEKFRKKHYDWIESIALKPSKELGVDSKIHNEIDVRKKIKINENVSNLYKCNKCKKKKTRTITYQGRSLDEGPTCMIQCVNESCGNTWRLG